MNRRITLPIFFLATAALACNLPSRLSPTPGVTTGAGSETPSLSATSVSPQATSPVPRGATSTLCSDPQPPLISDLEVYQTPGMPEPAARVPFRDPVFGTCLVRVTDRKADLTPGDTSAGLKHEYSRVQSFNADGSRILARGINATWYLYDTGTLQPIEQIPIGSDPRWDAADPNILYYSEETRLMTYDVSSREATLVHEFASDPALRSAGQTLAAVWTRYEGSPSRDGRYWGLMAEDQDWRTTALLVYDRVEDRVLAERDMPTRPEIDSVTISPLGNYFLAYDDEYCEPGTLGDEAHPCGLMVYDRDLTNGRSLLRIVGHSDLALDAEGREVMVFQDIDADSISLLDLASGAVTPLWPIDFSHTPIGLHFSGRAFNRPGWALVSTHDGDPAAYTWMDDLVFALELKSGGRVVRLAHTHSLVDANQEHDYWAEPHASANPDFTRVLFTSNWGRSGTGEVEMFMIDLPPDWTAAGAAPQPVAAAPTAPASVQGLALNTGPPGTPDRLIFIHHSSGENWLADEHGGLGRALDQNNYFVSDTNYGWGPDGIGDRTDIINWPEWFRGPNSGRYLAALYAENGQNAAYTRTLPNPGGENEIVMFKSCFPNSILEGNPVNPAAPGEGLTVSNVKYIYNDLLQYFATRPDKLFIIITAPPVQDATYAANARAFNTWLVRDWLAENGYGQRNVAVFDFYNVLTDPDNHHRYHDGAIEYVTDRGAGTLFYPTDGDDHASPAGSQKATGEFIPWLNVVVNCWRGEGGCP